MSEFIVPEFLKSGLSQSLDLNITVNSKASLHNVGKHDNKISLVSHFICLNEAYICAANQQQLMPSSMQSDLATPSLQYIN